MISLIETIHQDGTEVFVRAIVEDMVVLYSQTMESPAEYGPAMCETSFSLNEDEVLPEEDDELIDYLNSLDLNWNIDDDWSYGTTD